MERKNKFYPIKVMVVTLSFILLALVPMLWVSFDSRNASAAGDTVAITPLCAVNQFNYGSAYDASKKTMIFQFYQGTTLVQSKALDWSNDGNEVTTGGSLTLNTYYNVKVLAPSFLDFNLTVYSDAWSVDLTVDASSFTFYNTSEMTYFDININGLTDESWLTDFVAPGV